MTGDKRRLSLVSRMNNGAVKVVVWAYEQTVHLCAQYRSCVAFDCNAPTKSLGRDQISAGMKSIESSVALCSGKKGTVKIAVKVGADGRLLVPL
jgi:hypothetical protein